MREIKFRAWHDGLMYEVYRLLFENGRIIFIDMINKQECALFHADNPESYVLMQYTGLLDKNGKEIYEGDIVKIDGGNYMYAKMFEGRYQVYWNEDRWGLKDKNGNEYLNGNIYEPNEINWQQCVVLGNIYEHPELMEQA